MSEKIRNRYTSGAAKDFTIGSDKLDCIMTISIRNEKLIVLTDSYPCNFAFNR